MDNLRNFILDNKLKITNEVELSKIEEKLPNKKHLNYLLLINLMIY